MFHADSRTFSQVLAGFAQALQVLTVSGRVLAGRCNLPTLKAGHFAQNGFEVGVMFCVSKAIWDALAPVGAVPTFRMFRLHNWK